MKVYRAIAESAEDAPLLHTNTVDADEKKPSFTSSRKKTIALAVAGVAACGVVAIAKGSGASSASFGQIHNAPSRLGDALDDAKAGTTFVVPMCFDLSLGKRFDSIRTRPKSSSLLVFQSL